MTAYQNFYLPVGFYFKVMIDGINEKYEAGFQEVSGLDVKLETGEITEGGENRFKFKLPSQAKYTNLTLKRGPLVGEPFMNWINEAVTNFKFQPKTFIVMLLNEQGGPLINWTFHNAYPVSVSVSNLNSGQNKYAIETLELAYDHFERVDSNPN